MPYSDVLATIAIVVSIATAVWTVTQTARWDRPVIRVHGETWIHAWNPDATPRRFAFSTVISNSGNVTTQILESHWELDQGSGEHLTAHAGPGGSDIDSLFRDPNPETDPPPMPFDLGRNQQQEWTFDMSADGAADPARLKRARPVATYRTRKGTVIAYGRWLELRPRATSGRPD